MDLFGQVEFCSKCPVGIWIDASLVIREPSDELEVVGHKTLLVRSERAIVMGLEYCNEQ